MNDCCHSPPAHESLHAHGHARAHLQPAVHSHAGHRAASPVRLAASATLHCLTGCAIGELAGVALGVALGLGPWMTMVLGTLGGYASGYTLGLRPLVQQGMGWIAAFRRIWLGETISIAAMELAMNLADYAVGGVQARSLASPVFWAGYAVALPAGFIAAWPVNFWLLSRNVKQQCH